MSYVTIGSSNKYLSCLEYALPTFIPCKGYSLAGILKDLISLLSSKAKQIYSSISSCPLPGLRNVHLGYLPVRLATFRSMALPSYMKSAGVLNERDGRSAPKVLINQFSHSMPIMGLPSKILRLVFLFLIYQARLLHRVEQYLSLGERSIISWSIGAKHNSHNIFRL